MNSNSDMMLDLSRDEMMNLWKTRMRLLPARRDCTMERDDGIDVDAVLQLDIDQWYAQLLTTGPTEWLPVEDLAGECLAEVDDEGVVTVELPGRCVRPEEWRLEGWRRSVVQFHPAGSIEALRQRNIYMRGDEQRPVAVLHDGRLLLYSIAPGNDAMVTQARCIVLPEGGRYRFHQAALEKILLCSE